MDFTITCSTKPVRYRWRLEVRGLSTGKWVGMDDSSKRTRQAAEREFRAGMYRWIFARREWRIVEI